MPDVLSPAEQARAARWVKDWLLKCEFVESETAQDAITALGFYIDKLDPLETVESLRAERDAAQHVAEYWREQFRLVCDESKDRKTEIARLRATHTEAEAAWERCRKPKLFPTSWQGENTSQPEGVDKVRDTEGREWERVGSEWRCRKMRKSWRHLIQEQGTVTEVLP